MEIIASGGADNNIMIWDVFSGDLISTLEGHTKCVDCVCFSPCDTLLASGSRDGTIMVWNCQSWSRMQTFIEHSEVRAVCFIDDGERIVSYSGTYTIRVWNLKTKLVELKIVTELVTFATSVSVLTRSIAVAGRILVHIYGVDTGESKGTLHGDTGCILSIQFSRDGSKLVSGSADFTAMLWDVASGRVLRVLQGNTSPVSHVCFNADASRILTCSWDCKTCILDASSGECTLTLVGHGGSVFSGCFSEDGSKVITSSDDGTVKVWDSYTGEELRTLRGHTDAVWSIVYRLVVGSYI